MLSPVSAECSLHDSKGSARLFEGLVPFVGSHDPAAATILFHLSECDAACGDWSVALFANHATEIGCEGETNLK
jgi:hypothetical protein